MSGNYPILAESFIKSQRPLESTVPEVWVFVVFFRVALLKRTYIVMLLEDNTRIEFLSALK